jgi:hypothetical protein
LLKGTLRLYPPKVKFQGEAVPDSRMHDIEAAFTEVMAAYRFITTDKILDKTYQLHEIHTTYRSIILLGVKQESANHPS